jgi:hypothetical protein
LFDSVHDTILAWPSPWALSYVSLAVAHQTGQTLAAHPPASKKETHLDGPADKKRLSYRFRRIAMLTFVLQLVLIPLHMLMLDVHTLSLQCAALFAS